MGPLVMKTISYKFSPLAIDDAERRVPAVPQAKVLGL